MPTLSFTADDYIGLRDQMEAFLADVRSLPAMVAAPRRNLPTPLVPTAAASVEEPKPRKPAAKAGREKPADAEMEAHGRRIQAEQEIAAARRDATQSQIDDAEEAQPEPEQEPKTIGEMVDSLALKEATLLVLREAFASGKKDQVLALLAKHGNGAKKFQQIEDKAFPAIREDIAAGALA